MSLPQTSGADASSTVVIYSGGMDSYTVLHRAIKEGLDVHALSFDYGQRHTKELDIAKAVCKQHNIPHQIVDIRAIHGLIDNSALTNPDLSMPEGNYAADNLHTTVVPNRNMILLSLAIAKAVNIGAARVDYGAHGGDHILYPDCRPEFVHAMNHVAGIANFEPVTLHVPYLTSSKADILRDGLAMGLDYRDTWTCYEGRALACGKCGSCHERLAAFAANDVVDPLTYESTPAQVTG
ncbi:7-cyano-7-deazaguanine synthase QueC [Halomonas sp. TD01]|uniref:7-cyano-7-deazaguanine synthase QueC n=1 Tax=Halomonas sp. TD01 TaxID=999141 RepID=UPI000214E2F5|nr:7-cyano-7-deazaguanine synthase QueC [Halomonas sp. TD01]EGP19538.1 queuosine biosynthesis protein QueC [Halomonas sp. TD01]CAH1044818.1 7-cyano-7-deazaguanine synthase (EC [Halomonas sp. TD01]